MRELVPGANVVDSDEDEGHGARALEDGVHEVVLHVGQGTLSDSGLGKE